MEITTDAPEAPDADEPRQRHEVLLTAADVAATRAKIDKINTRAVRRGFTGRYELHTEPVNQQLTLPDGSTVDGIMWRSKLTGSAPCYAGWRFVARFRREGDSYLVHPFPGIERDWAKLTPRAERCEHCQTRRARARMFLLERADDPGVSRMVGSSCVKDFLGWTGSLVFQDSAELEEELEWAGAFGRGGAREWSVESVLAIAVAMVGQYGWAPASAGSSSTAEQVRGLLAAAQDFADARTADTQAVAAGAVECQAQPVRSKRSPAARTARKILRYVASREFDASSAYGHNLRVACAAEYATQRMVGLLCSAVPVWQSHLEDLTRADTETAGPARASQHVGVVGEKITLTVRIDRVIVVEDHYSFYERSKPIYLMSTLDGDVIKWSASRFALDGEVGDTITITGTIKAHSQYQPMSGGEPVAQTAMIRVRQFPAGG